MKIIVSVLIMMMIFSVNALAQESGENLYSEQYGISGAEELNSKLPDETKEFGVVEGKDHVTLVTCTPYGINSHRLLVRGERVNQSEMIQNQLAGKGDRCSVGVRQGIAVLCTVELTEEAVQKLI